MSVYMLYHNTYLCVCQAFMKERDLKQTTIIRFTNCYGPLFEVTLAGVLLVLFFKPPRHVKGPAHKPALSSIYFFYYSGVLSLVR